MRFKLHQESCCPKTSLVPLIALLHLLAGKISAILNVLNFEHFREGPFSLFPKNTVFFKKETTTRKKEFSDSNDAREVKRFHSHLTLHGSSFSVSLRAHCSWNLQLCFYDVGKFSRKDRNAMRIAWFRKKDGSSTVQEPGIICLFFYLLSLRIMSLL